MTSKLQVEIIQHTPDPERVVAQAGRLCYSALTIRMTGQKLTREKITELIKRLIHLGHYSALEHAVFTFGIEGVSRALTHQLVRHRIASYSQQSQRYVSMRNFSYITPESIASRPELLERYQQNLQAIGQTYAELLQAGIPAEDARYLLPNACETKIVMTMNARELRHFYSLRCCNRAQWEIHALADKMLALCQSIAPNLFQNAGPGCLRGACPEGEMSCQQATATRSKYLPSLQK